MVWMARKDIWQKKRKWPIWAGYIVAIIVLGYIGYSVYYYLSTQENVEEFEVCYADKCIKTFHTHADISIELCGKRVMLALEKGALEGPHTHKERNMIHFHERLPYEPTTGKILDTKPLELGTFMNEMDMRFNDRCIGQYCNGDLCPDGKPGAVRMFVNEQPNSEFDKYVWNDKDKIKITFD
jgi:hypothetical protein